MFIHHLNPAERLELQLANRALTRLTARHCHNCICVLCEARWRTDTQEETAFHVPFTPESTEDDNVGTIP